MTFWILPHSCKVLARLTVRQLTDDELENPVTQGMIAELDNSIKSKIGDTLVDDKIDNKLIGIYPDVPDDVFLPDRDDDIAAERDAEMPEADD